MVLCCLPAGDGVHYGGVAPGAAKSGDPKRVESGSLAKLILGHLNPISAES